MGVIFAIIAFCELLAFSQVGNVRVVYVNLLYSKSRFISEIRLDLSRKYKSPPITITQIPLPLRSLFHDFPYYETDFLFIRFRLLEFRLFLLLVPVALKIEDANDLVNGRCGAKISPVAFTNTPLFRKFEK